MRRENKISCREFRRGKNILPTTRLLEKKILADQKSFLRTRSRPFCIFSMTTLPITLLPTGNNVTPRQFLHSFKSPRFGIFTIKPFFHWSGIFSSCHILLNSLVNSFTATSLSALYSSAGIPSIPGVLPIFVFFSACLTSASLLYPSP